MTNNNWYHEKLMDHYRHPRHCGLVEQPDFSSQSLNPSCGDSVQFAGKLQGTTVAKVGFEGKGCVISQASASMLAEHVVGKTVDDVLKVSTQDMLGLVGLELGPNRMRCALLALEALQGALRAQVA